MKKLFIYSSLLLFMFGLTIQNPAQSATATLGGTVVDANGAFVSAFGEAKILGRV